MNRKMKVKLLNITQEISKRVAVLLLVGMILVGSTPLDPIFAMLGIEINSEYVENTYSYAADDGIYNDLVNNLLTDDDLTSEDESLEQVEPDVASGDEFYHGQDSEETDTDEMVEKPVFQEDASVNVEEETREQEMAVPLSEEEPLRIVWRYGDIDASHHLDLEPTSTLWQHHTMRIYFRASTTLDNHVYGPNEIEIRIPRFIMERRDGGNQGEFDQNSIQMPNSAAADATNLGFHFVVESNYVILRNHRDVDTTEPFHFDIPFHYLPSHVADGFTNTIYVEVEYFNAERLRTEVSNEITLELTTNVTVNQPQKLLRGTPEMRWQNIWGLPPANAVNYFFVVYDIHISHTDLTTQPFNTRLLEMPENDGEVMAWTPFRENHNPTINLTSWYRGNTAAFNTSSPLTNWSRPSTTINHGSDNIIFGPNISSDNNNRNRWVSVVVAYPRTGELNQTVTNCIQWTVRGIDATYSMTELLTMENLESIRNAERFDVCVEIAVNDIGFDTRGEWGIYKDMNAPGTMRPFLTTLLGRGNIRFGIRNSTINVQRDMRRHVAITAGAYHLTNGGTEPFRTQVIDDVMFMEVGGIFHQLNPEDYRFTGIEIYNFFEEIAVYNGDNLIGGQQLPRAERSPIRLYYMPLGTSTWEYLATFTPDEELHSPYFPIPDHIHAYQIMAVHNNGQYWLEFDMNFSFELFATDHIRGIVGNRDSVGIHNFANLQVFHYNDPQRTTDLIAVDSGHYTGSLAQVLRDFDQLTYGHYVLRVGDHLAIGHGPIQNRVRKDAIGSVSDTTHGRQVVTYSLAALMNTTWSGMGNALTSESIRWRNDALRYSGITMNEGVFYDLLPRGAILDTSSILVHDMFGVIPFRLYTHENYRGSGQTLVEIHVASTAEFNIGEWPTSLHNVSTTSADRSGTGFRVQFDIFYPWDAITDFGSDLRNVAAFQSREGALRGQALEGTNIADLPAWADDATNHGSFSSREQDLMSNLAPPGLLSAGERNTVYMQNNTQVPVNLSTNAGFSKMIRAAGDDSYRMNTSGTPGGNYHYRLRFQNFDNSIATNLVMFDVLEVAHGGVPHWQGTFESVDLSQPIYRGIAPVVYFSTRSDVNPVGNPSVYADLTNTDIWTTIEPEDRSTITAIAIDMTYDTDGELFEIAPSSSVVVNVHMIAPTDQQDGPLAHNRASFGITLRPILGGDSDPRPPAYSQITTIDLPDPVVSIRKTSIPESGTYEEPTEVLPGDVITYHVSVTNNEDILTIRNIVVSDEIPFGLILNPANLQGFFGNDPETARPLSEISQRVTATVTGRTVEWTIASLGAGETFTMVIPTTVDPALREETTFVNQGVITEINGREVEEESEETFHRAEPGEVEPPTITKDACPIVEEVEEATGIFAWFMRLFARENDEACSEIVEQGQFILYTLTVTNPNEFDLRDILVVDNLANGQLTEVQNVAVRVTDSEDEIDYDDELILNDVTELYELHVLFPILPAESDVVITFEARVSDELFEGLASAMDIVNTVYLFGSRDAAGEREVVDEDDAVVEIEPEPCETIISLPEGTTRDDVDYEIGEDGSITITVTRPGNLPNLVVTVPPGSTITVEAGEDGNYELVIISPPMEDGVCPTIPNLEPEPCETIIPLPEGTTGDDVDQVTNEDGSITITVTRPGNLPNLVVTVPPGSTITVEEDEYGDYQLVIISPPMENGVCPTIPGLEPEPCETIIPLPEGTTPDDVNYETNEDGSITITVIRPEGERDLVVTIPPGSTVTIDEDEYGDYQLVIISPPMEDGVCPTIPGLEPEPCETIIPLPEGTTPSDVGQTINEDGSITITVTRPGNLPNLIVTVPPGSSITVEGDEDGNYELVIISSPMEDGVCPTIPGLEPEPCETIIPLPEGTTRDDVDQVTNEDGSITITVTRPGNLPNLVVTVPPGSTITVEADEDDNYELVIISPPMEDGVCPEIPDLAPEPCETIIPLPEGTTRDDVDYETNEDGSITITVTRPEGERDLVVTVPPGSTITVERDEDGNYELVIISPPMENGVCPTIPGLEPEPCETIIPLPEGTTGDDVNHETNEDGSITITVTRPGNLPNLVVTIPPGSVITVERDEDDNYELVIISPPMENGVCPTIPGLEPEPCETIIPLPEGTTRDDVNQVINEDGSITITVTRPGNLPNLVVTVPPGSTITVERDEDDNYQLVIISPPMENGVCPTIPNLEPEEEEDVPCETIIPLPEGTTPDDVNYETNEDGSITITVTRPEGERDLVVTIPPGSTITVEVDEDGNYELVIISPPMEDGVCPTIPGLEPEEEAYIPQLPPTPVNPTITKSACPLEETEESRGIIAWFLGLFTRSDESEAECSRVVEQGQFIAYTLTVTNPNNVALTDHLVVDNLANGRLTDVRRVAVYPSTIVFDYEIYENDITGFNELRVILDELPAETSVVITFEARIVDDLFEDLDDEPVEIINTVYLFGPEDENGDRGEMITPDDEAEDGFIREGDIDRDDAVVEIVPEADSGGDSSTGGDDSNIGGDDENQAGGDEENQTGGDEENQTGGDEENQTDGDEENQTGGDDENPNDDETNPASRPENDLPQTGAVIAQFALAGTLIANGGLAVAVIKQRHKKRKK